MTTPPSAWPSRDRTLASQAVIREIAGLLSTFPGHDQAHPEACIPIAEAIYDAHMLSLHEQLAACVAALIKAAERHHGLCEAHPGEHPYYVFAECPAHECVEARAARVTKPLDKP